MEDNKLNFIDFEHDTMEGFEQINSQSLAIPFVKILQKQSPVCDEDSPGYVKGAKAGLFMNSVSKQIMGNEINVIFLKFERLYLEWGPDRGGLVDVHSVEHAQDIAADMTFGSWRTKSGNTLAENYVYYVLIEGQESEGLMILSLASSNIKKAKEINRSIVSHIMPDGNRARPYYLVHKIFTERRENEKGSWYGLNFAFDHYINKAQYELLKIERKGMDQQAIDYNQLDESKKAQPKAEQIAAPY